MTFEIGKYINEDVFKQLKRTVYSRSYYEFFKDAYLALHPGGIYSDNWHIKYLCDILQDEAFRINVNKAKGNDIIINMPFRAAKSLIVSVVFPIWCWTIDPTMKFICVSYTADLAMDLAKKSRQLMNSPWFHEFYGDKVKVTTDAIGSITIAGGGVRYSVGTGGTVTGKGADIIILDDPLNPKKSKSLVERKNANDFYTGTLYNRLNQPKVGVRIVVMQRLHEEDLSGFLLANNRSFYDHICIPAELASEKDHAILSPKELEENYIDGLFWPDRFDRIELNNYKKQMGSSEAAGQLQQRPAPDEGNMVKRSWFDMVDAESVTLDLINSPMNFYLDTAETAKQENDATGILVMFKKDNIVYVANAQEIRKEFHELVKYIPQFCIANRYNQNSKVKIEPKSSGKSVVSQLRASTMLNVVELPSPKDDKITRLNAISPLLESRRVRVIKGSYVTAFMDQLCTFPNSTNDDMVDGFVHGVTDLLMEGDFDYMFL